MSNGVSPEEETELRLENTILRQRLEINRLKDQLEVTRGDALRYRRMYDQAIRRVAIFHPYLAQVTEEDAFRLWEMDVS